MAENLNVTPGTGAVIGMDSITDPTLSTALVGFGKIMDGNLGGTNKMTVTSLGAAKVDGSAVTQPISGNVSISGGITLAGAVSVNQGTSPWLTNASIVGNLGVNASIQGIIPVSQSGAWGVTASIAGTVPVSTGNINVSLVGTSVVSGTVTANQGTNPWLTNASIVGTPNVAFASGATVTANQGTSPWTVSGNVSLTGISPVSQSGNWLVTLAGNVSIGAITVAANSSITAFQGGSPWLVNASVIGSLPVTGTFFQGTQPVSGSVTVSLLAPATVTLSGPITANQGTNPWVVSGNVSVGSISVSTNSSITAFQGGAPWTVNASIIGTVPVSGSFAIASGSTVAAQQLGAPWLVNASVIGTVPVSGFPTAVNVSLLAPATVTLSGAISVNANNVSLVGISPVSQSGSPWLVNASIIGTVPVSGFPTAVNVSLLAPATVTLSGAITVNQGTAAALASPWPVYAGEQGDFTGTFTNATQTTSVTATNLDGYGNVLVSINGTYGTATAVFEGSDDSGTTWYPVDAARTSGNVVESGYTSLTNTNMTWQINVPGFDSVRVRSTAVASGTVNVRMSTSSAIGSDAATISVASGNLTIAGSVGLVSGATLTAYQGTSPWLVSASLPGPVNLSPLGGGWNSYASPSLSALVSISATGGKFGGYMVMNLNSAPAYLQVFDVAATANASLGLNYKMLIPIPANSTPANGLAANLEMANGASLANGLAVAFTQGVNASIVGTAGIGTIWYH